MSDKRLGFRLTARESAFVERMVASRTYRTRSALMHQALADLMARYGGEPTLTSVSEAVERLRARCDGYDEALRQVNKHLKEMEERA